MDKNTIIGLVLIGLVVLGFSWLNRPDPAAIEARQQAQREAFRQDSLAIVEADSLQALADAARLATDTSSVTDKLQMQYGLLSKAASGTSQSFQLKNKHVELSISSKGAAIESVKLPEYKTYDGKDLYLFTEEDVNFNLPLRTADSRMVDTQDLYFQAISQTDSSLTMRLSLDSAAYLDIAYTLLKDDYRVKMHISGQNLHQIFPSNMTMQDLEWKQRIRRQEKSWKFENQYSSIYYKFPSGDVDRLSELKNDTESVKEPIKWVAFKDKYFSAVLISENNFENNKLETKVYPSDSEFIKDCSMQATFPFDTRAGTEANFEFFFGPLKYKMLSGYDKGLASADKLNLERLVYLGASVFRLINQFMIIPTVELLKGFISNWGIMILVLTILIKLLISPLTFKSYLSSAKMRVLRPQVKAISDKFPGKDQETMMKKQQATMSLYRSAGASPMSGCLPMLIQMPFLIAMYMYFPTSIDLRQQSFLWANDLSSYDAIISWTGNIPLVTNYLGNHISLFCLLMTITNIFYTKYTMSQNDTGQEGMAAMKWMPYIMSVMFFFFFNQNASGLSYYYFLSSLITILQYLASRYIINEDKLLKQLEENKKKPRKKSKWMARLEEAQKQQEAMRRQQQKGKR